MKKSKSKTIAIVGVLGIAFGLIVISKKVPESEADKTRLDETQVLESPNRGLRDDEVELLKAVRVETVPQKFGNLDDFVLRMSQLGTEFSGAKLQDEQVKLIDRASRDLNSMEMQEFVPTILSQVSDQVVLMTSERIMECILLEDFEVYEQWFKDLGESDMELVFVRDAVGSRIRMVGDTESADRILSLLSGKKREAGIYQYGSCLAKLDGNRAIQFLEDHGQLQKRSTFEIGQVVSGVSPDTDFEALIPKSAVATQIPKGTWESMIVRMWAMNRQEEAWDWVQRNRNEAEKPPLIAAAVKSWYDHDFTGLATFLDRQPPGVDRDVAAIQFAKLAVSRDRDSAIEWLESVQSEPYQTEAKKLIKEFLAE